MLVSMGFPHPSPLFLRKSLKPPLYLSTSLNTPIFHDSVNGYRLSPIAKRFNSPPIKSHVSESLNLRPCFSLGTWEKFIF
jgi:hypothetical protein